MQLATLRARKPNLKILVYFPSICYASVWVVVGMCLSENYSDSPSNEYLQHYSESPSISDVTRVGKYAFAFLVLLHLAASEPLG